MSEVPKVRMVVGSVTGVVAIVTPGTKVGAVTGPVKKLLRGRW